MLARIHSIASRHWDAMSGSRTAGMLAKLSAT
jgi:hypothetical protein